MKRQTYSHWWPLIKMKIIGTCEKFLGKGVLPKKYFIRFLPKNPVILEAGAHRGKDTVEMAKMWPAGTIHAFEPVPSLFKKLEDSTRNLKNVHCHQIALGNNPGEEVMYVSSGSSDGSSSLLPPKEHLNVFPTVYFDSKIKVTTTTLDAWAESNNIRKIDFMWLDLQGMELNVLKSGTNILRTVTAIYTEVSGIEAYKEQTLYSDLAEWLVSNGFRIEREVVENSSGNVFFLRK
ncbi:FkbM family methyltransferase [bacterium]|nr:FkbM family methyltransferase [bacterium]